MSGDLSARAEMAQMVSRALLKSRPYTKPIVAAVNGVCAGGGVELLLSTDVRAAAPHARFGLPEVKWSIYPFGGATIKLIQQIGYVHAMELLLTGGLIDADEAVRLGLINRVVPAGRLMPWAMETAERIAANSPSAVQAVKQQISTTLAEHARRARRSSRSWAIGSGRARTSRKASRRFVRSASRATSEKAMSEPIRVHLRVPGTAPMSELVRHVQSIEAGGFDGAGILDSQMISRDTFVVLGQAAANTAKLTLFPAVTNPFTRHASVLAGGIQTVEEIAPGRVKFVMGTGYTSASTIAPAACDAGRDARLHQDGARAARR